MRTAVGSMVILHDVQESLLLNNLPAIAE